MRQLVVGLDIDVLRRALVAGTEGHDVARSFAIRLSAGLETYAVPAPAILALVDILLRNGAGAGWAMDRADDVLRMCSVLDVCESDIAAGLETAGASGVSPRVATTAAVFARHGIATVVAFAPEFDLLPHVRRVAPDAVEDL